MGRDENFQTRDKIYYSLCMILPLIHFCNEQRNFYFGIYFFIRRLIITIKV